MFPTPVHSLAEVCGYTRGLSWKKCSLNDFIILYLLEIKLFREHFRATMYVGCGPGSSVSIATGYGLDGPGIESRWWRNFPHLSRSALGPTQPPVQWVPGLSRGKQRTGRDADSSPLLVPWSRKGRAIPLLPLWAVRPVQSLSACTRVHFTFTFTYVCKITKTYVSEVLMAGTGTITSGHRLLNTAVFILPGEYPAAMQTGSAGLSNSSISMATLVLLNLLYSRQLNGM